MGQEDEKEKKDYEVSFLAREEKGGGEVLHLLTQSGAEVFLEGPLEHITLAYKIQKEPSAYFGYFHFRISPEGIKPLRESLGMKPFILRFLIVSPPLEKPKSRWTPKERTKAPTETLGEKKKQPETLPLSNEALERRIEEILK